MDTGLATNQIRLQHWAAIIHDRKEIGLKIDDYCKLHNLSRNATTTGRRSSQLSTGILYGNLCRVSQPIALKSGVSVSPLFRVHQ